VKSLTLLLCLVTAVLRADPDAALVEKLYAKLASSFSAAQALGQQGEVLLLAHPGFALAAADLQDPFEISRLADQIPMPARYYVPSGSNYSSTYDAILTLAEVSNFQNMAERQKALLARRLLYDKNRPRRPTKEYEAYLTFQAACCSAQDALSLAQTEQRTTGRAVLPALAKAAEAARKNWEDQGNRKLIDDARKDLATFYNQNVKYLFATLHEEFASAADRGSHPVTWYPVTATPPPETWLGDPDWKPFSLTSTETSLAAGTPAIPLEAPGDKPLKKLPDDFLSTLSISLDTKRVVIARPWLDERIFASHAWRLWKASGFTTVSTGNPSDPNPGLMPFLVTGVLLSRNLVLQGSWSQSSTSSVEALGPFNLKGATTTSKGGKLCITAPGAQIVGFFCTAVPKSPSPEDKAFRTNP
jgi:hypothetical protein